LVVDADGGRGASQASSRTNSGSSERWSCCSRVNLSVVLRSPRLAAAPSPALASGVRILLDGDPLRRTEWSPTPFVGSCCNPLQQRCRTRERQSGAPSIERVLHREASQQGAVQIPLHFTGTADELDVPATTNAARGDGTSSSQRAPRPVMVRHHLKFHQLGLTLGGDADQHLPPILPLYATLAGTGRQYTASQHLIDAQSLSGAPGGRRSSPRPLARASRLRQGDLTLALAGLSPSFTVDRRSDTTDPGRDRARSRMVVPARRSTRILVCTASCFPSLHLLPGCSLLAPRAQGATWRPSLWFEHQPLPSALAPRTQFCGASASEVLYGVTPKSNGIRKSG